MAKVKRFMDKMEDEFGEDYGSLFIKEESIECISTGSLSLDSSLGLGGVPKKRFTLFEGPEGSGKSTIALSTAKQCIKSGEKVLYVDVENQSPVEYIARIVGEHTLGDSFILVKPQNSDQAFKVLEAGIDSKEFGLIILDSIAALSPPEEQAKDFEDASMAIIPRDLAKFFRRNAHKVRENNVAVLLLNQVRDTIGSYVKSFSSPGGHALKHYASIIVSFTRGQEIKLGEETIGINVRFSIRKNKIAPPFRNFIMPILFEIGVDTLRDSIDFAEHLGVVRKGGPYYKFEETTLGKGKLDTMIFLENNPEVLDKLMNMCYNILSKNHTDISEEESEVMIDEDN